MATAFLRGSHVCRDVRVIGFIARFFCWSLFFKRMKRTRGVQSHFHTFPHHPDRISSFCFIYTFSIFVFGCISSMHGGAWISFVVYILFLFFFSVVSLRCTGEHRFRFSVLYILFYFCYRLYLFDAQGNIDTALGPYVKTNRKQWTKCVLVSSLKVTVCRTENSEQNVS